MILHFTISVIPMLLIYYNNYWWESNFRKVKLFLIKLILVTIPFRFLLENFLRILTNIFVEINYLRNLYEN